MFRYLPYSCALLLFCQSIELTLSAQQEICRKSENKDIDHPEPGSNCVTAERSGLPSSIGAYHASEKPVERDETEYHDSRVFKTRNQKLLGKH